METLKVRVEKMAPQGAALSRAPGSSRIVFVAHGAPGDLLEVRAAPSEKSFVHAKLLKVLEPGPERCAPRCPLHFVPEKPGPFCGGCEWQHLNAVEQVNQKRDIVRDCLSRIGGFGSVPVAETIASPQSWGYRNKVLMPFSPAPSPGGRPRAGFYAARSHEIVDLEQCPVQPGLALTIARKVKDLAAQFNWHIYDENRHRGWLRHLLVRTTSGGKALAALVTRTPDFPRRSEFISEMTKIPGVSSLFQNHQPQKTSVVLGHAWKKLWGADGIEEKIGALTFFASPGAFLQVNTPAAEKLYATALSFLQDSGKRFRKVLDLYCGVGTLSCWIAKSGPNVIGIEGNESAVVDAFANARRNGLKNVRFQAARVESVLPRMIRDAEGPWAAVVDPPRSGLRPPALKALTRPIFRRIVYVSCDPATFARDAHSLCDSGYVLRKVQPLDLFPQTSHVELVALLDRPLDL